VSERDDQQLLALAPVVDRASWATARDTLLDREKAHTRAGGATTAERRSLR
jgi:predicted dithiol-disulfide oxidoreductase (DUF899 family)